MFVAFVADPSENTWNAANEHWKSKFVQWEDLYVLWLDEDKERLELEILACFSSFSSLTEKSLSQGKISLSTNKL